MRSNWQNLNTGYVTVERIISFLKSEIWYSMVVFLKLLEVCTEIFKDEMK